ncbi:MAG: NAD(P)-binding domain-containing protein [Candidatus Gracilibacteria bacterium]|nr:NAD(P)-binding domain-containing protein [Candidatus Gracilibacteria bacterium]MCP4524096.1 NAD(P)-binding domain-containing protein [Candidatus Gracilibacteria bacterium]
MITAHDVIIIGAGPAGLGIGMKLKELDIDYLILEKDQIGASFLQWNNKTRFISPSFPSNAFGQIDLNSIDASSSPALFTKKQNPNGGEYAEYLKDFSIRKQLNIKNNSEVITIEKDNEIFKVFTKKYKYFAKFICCATGEFNFPNYGNITGKELGIHSSKIKNYDRFDTITGAIPIIGGYESSIDLAYNLIKLGKKVSVFSNDNMDNYNSSDPSKILSPVSMQKLHKMQQSELFSFTKDIILSLSYDNKSYVLKGKHNEYNFIYQPILATGFKSNFEPLGDLVTYRNDGNPQLNEFDELKKTKGIFISGPMVRQEELIFCFIYKFRQRFGIIALEIAQRLGKNIDYQQIKKSWIKQGFYLDDFSCCENECVC